ncbi:hypothetical protein JD844_032721 [Phrynosoma platyrhinos]|uniref:Uncharacterized protein n=1 Tax=Phrynosoma platyrhinos TaxID=52577 RepID=A0ABQ7T5B8_PHRPL|nr:hypothetical protein JD844_032721 [Phrynosoma platyrhinos]
MVPEPQNVRLHSIMFDSVLQWDPPNFHNKSLVYTVQHRKKFNNTFADMCRRIVFTECNMSSIPIYGHSIIRVRTESENKYSNWVTINFTPYTDTIIGPPAVQVEATKPGVLNVQLTDPFFTRSGVKYSFKNLYASVVYRIRIWKKYHSDKEVLDVNSTYTFQIIPDLDPMTTYCLKAQVFIEDLNKGGQWSEPICTNTTDKTDPGNI